MYTGTMLHQWNCHAHLTPMYTCAGSWNNDRLALLGDEVLDVIVLQHAMLSAPVAEGSKEDKSGNCNTPTSACSPDYT